MADVDEARQLYEMAMDAEDDNRREALIDLRFRALEGQWDENIKAQRLREKRPCFVFDRTGQIVRQIAGDIRLNPPAITVRPQDSGADPELAETLTGLMRNIEAVSTADAHYVAAAELAITCGMGFLRARYDYTDDTAFDMDFSIEHIPSPFAAIWDPGAVLPCREDAEFWFLSDLYTERTFKKKWPKASLDGWDNNQIATWRSGDFVRVAEYWHKVPTTRHLLFLADGRTIDVTELPLETVQAQIAQAQQASGAPSGVLRERKAQSSKICMTLMNGSEQLEEDYYWPGRFIPIAPVFGEQIQIGDRVVRRGVIRAARDAQVRYNVQTTAITETLAMSPKPKWIGSIKNFLNLEKYWSNAHLNNTAYLPFNPDQQNPQGPQRVQPDPPPAGLMADMQGAAMDIEATTGVYRENLGKETNAISGKAILSRQREGDVGAFLYADNLARAVQHIGRVIVDAMPSVYDTQRVVRTLGEDGKTKFAALNQPGPDGKMINDISMGRYDVVASTGPMFSTRREEGREFLMAMMQGMPQAAAAGADILASMSDAPGADELAKRLRKQAVASGIAEPEEGEQPPPPPPPDPNMLLAQAEMAKAQASMVKAQGDAQAKQAELQLRAAEVQLEGRRLELETVKTLVDAQKTEAQIREIMSSIRNDTAKTVIDAMHKTQSAQHERMGMEMKDFHATKDRQMADEHNMRGHAATQMAAQQESDD